jgi:hypothetical protein
MKVRTLAERKKDKPLEHGVLFREVRTMPCAAITFFYGHKCGPGVAPASAHHLGRDDLAGMIPACARFHDDLEERESRVEAQLRTEGHLKLKSIGRNYVTKALGQLKDRGELPTDIEAAARRRGYIGGTDG